MLLGYCVWETQATGFDSHAKIPSDTQWDGTVTADRKAQPRSADESIPVNGDGDSLSVGSFPSTPVQRTPVQKRRSCTSFVVSSARNISCATSSSILNTSFAARSDPLANAMFQGWCMSSCKLTVIRLAQAMRAGRTALVSFILRQINTS